MLHHIHVIPFSHFNEFVTKSRIFFIDWKFGFFWTNCMEYASSTPVDIAENTWKWSYNGKLGNGVSSIDNLN